MSMTNTPKPSASNVTNTSKVLSGETWASITTTWATETRTWTEIGSFMTNATKPTGTMTNTPRP